MEQIVDFYVSKEVYVRPSTAFCCTDTIYRKHCA
jgi:hypothetical protein